MRVSAGVMTLVALLVGAGVAGVEAAEGSWSRGPEAAGDNSYEGYIDLPSRDASLNVGSPLEVTGWVVDKSAQGWAGIDEVHLYEGKAGEGGVFLGKGVVAQPRPDVAAATGNPFWTASGFRFGLPATALGAGQHRLTVYAHTPAKGWWWKQVEVHVAAPNLATNADRAIAAYAAMQRHFAANHNLYRETYPLGDSRPYAYHWPFSQALVGTFAMHGLPSLGATYRPEVDERRESPSPYWDPSATPPGYASYVLPPLGEGGDKFYDDNAWTGLALVHLHRLTGDAAALERAKQVFDFVASGWDTDPSHPAPGGVFWVQADWNRDRNTVSTVPGAELALHLYELTGRTEGRYLDWAKRMLDWTDAHLRDPSGLYWDHIDLDGVVDKTIWSYNQGSAIGARVLLHRATGDPQQLARARQIADAALAHFGAEDRFTTQPAAFNAIFLRNLLLLQAAVGGDAYRAPLQRLADEAWKSARDPATNLFRFPSSETAPGQHHLLDQAAMVQVYAYLAWDPSTYYKIA